MVAIDILKRREESYRTERALNDSDDNRIALQILRQHLYDSANYPQPGISERARLGVRIFSNIASGYIKEGNVALTASGYGNNPHLEEVREAGRLLVQLQKQYEIGGNTIIQSDGKVRVMVGFQKYADPRTQEGEIALLRSIQGL